MQINPFSWKFVWLEGCLQLKEGFVNIIVIVIQECKHVGKQVIVTRLDCILCNRLGLEAL